jgi:tape measure domain-containing protein
MRKSAADLNDQLKRQEALMRAIRGPMTNYRADMAALDSLLRMNKISAAEFTEQVRKLGAELRRSQGAGAPGSGAGAGLGGGLKKAAITAGVSVGAKEIGELANEYQNLENRLRYLAGGDQAKVNAMFAETQRIAKVTRSDLSSTTEAFTRFTLATKDMGLSQSEVFSLTERLNKAIKLSGATSAEASAGMIQLSQGLASGALRGDELRSVMEQLPAVADVIAKSMNVSRGELRQMGMEGKITAEVVVEAFRKAGPELDAAFGTTLPTLADALTQFKNEMIVTFGELFKSTGIAYIFGAALQGILNIVKLVTGLFKTMADVFGGTATKIIVAVGAVGTAFAVGLGPVVALVAGINGVMYAANKLSDWVNRGTIALRKHYEMMIKVDEEYSHAMRAVSKTADEIHRSYIEHRLLDEGLVATLKSSKDFADALTAVGTALGLVGARLEAGQKVLIEENKKLTEAREKVIAYAGAVDILRQRMDELRAAGVVDPTALLTSGDVAAVRAYQDAQADVLDLNGRYGVVVQDIHKKERDRRRTIEDLKGALSEGLITQKQYNDAMAQFIPKGQKKKEKLIDIEKVVRDGAAAWDANYAAMKRTLSLFDDQAGLDAQAEREREVLELLRSLEGPADIYGQKLERLNLLYDEGSISLAQYIALTNKALGDSGLADQITKAEDARREKLTEKWKATLEMYQQEAQTRADLIAQVWAPINTALVDMFQNGEFALEEFAKSMERVLTEMAIKILMTSLLMGGLGLNGPEVGALGGDLGIGKLLGFATGGSFMVGGKGGTDSQVVAFRATPGEKVTVETGPQQKGGGGRGMAPQAAGPTTINNVFDKRALLPVLRTTEGRNEVLNIIRDNPGAVRAALQRSR